MFTKLSKDQDRMRVLIASTPLTGHFPAGGDLDLSDLDLSDRDASFPEWRKIPPGLERLRFALKHVYVDAIQPQHEGLREVLRELPEAQREEYAVISKEHDKIVHDPVKRYLNACLAGLGVEPLSIDLLHALVALPDAYLQLTVPSFEIPRQDLPPSVHFVGAPPIIPNQAPSATLGARVG
jgi:hypothetical protein